MLIQHHDVPIGFILIINFPCHSIINLMYSLGTLDLSSSVVFFECNPLKGICLFSKRPKRNRQDSHDFKGFLWEWYGSKYANGGPTNGGSPGISLDFFCPPFFQYRNVEVPNSFFGEEETYFYLRLQCWFLKSRDEVWYCSNIGSMFVAHGKNTWEL